jgi:acylphosphatase
VCNVEDGKVEALFKGRPESVDQMIKWCKEEGSPSSNVTHVEIIEDSSDFDGNDFEVRY